MRSAAFLLFATVVACGADAADDVSPPAPPSSPSAASSPSPAPAPSSPSSPSSPAPSSPPPDAEGPGPLTFPIPAKGPHLFVEAGPEHDCELLVSRRDFDFPRGALDPSVSMTAKTMCFHDATFIHCHTSGTGTGLCNDTFDNAVHVLGHPPTKDSDFVAAYVASHPHLRRNVSGHSQGAYDASRSAPLLREGDQLTLLQTPSASLVPNEALLDAIARGVRLYVVWSLNDNASLGIRITSGSVPLVELPYQSIDRVHNAPNARDQVLQWFHVPADRTINPALDASILSNPGSPTGPWRFPAWAP